MPFSKRFVKVNRRENHSEFTIIYKNVIFKHNAAFCGRRLLFHEMYHLPSVALSFAPMPLKNRQTAKNTCGTKSRTAIF